MAGVFAHDPLDAAATALVQAIEEKNPTMKWARARAVIGLITQQVCQELSETMHAQIKHDLRELLAPVLSEIEKP